MTNIVNQLVQKELTNEFNGVDGMVLVTFGGLTVKESEDLRGKLAEKGVRFKMVRNSLARRVLADRGVEFDSGALTGNTGIAYGDAEAAINAAKIFTDKDVKKAGKVKLQGGYLDGEVLGQQDTTQLANVPDKDTLRAQLLGCISGPARGIATVVDALPTGFARVLQGRADKLEE